MNYLNFYFFYFLRLLVTNILVFFIGAVIIMFSLELIYSISINLSLFFDRNTVWKLLTGSIISSIAGLIWFISQYKKAVQRGKESLITLNQNGYHAEVHQISPDIRIPFYKINNELFYNYSPFARDIGFMLSGIKKIIKHAESKNLVINMADSSVKLAKLEDKVLANFSSEFDKILIIDKAHNIIKLK
jgi:hypothetical protein